MIVRWGLAELPALLRELGVARPLLVASRRWGDIDLDAAARWDEIPSHRIEVPGDVDGIVAVGGGSAIDTAKAASAASGLPLVSIPTTYSGSEWTSFFGVRDPGRRMRGGGGGAHNTAIVYDVELTLDLPRAQTGGTALNALAHCAEALYHPARTPESDAAALEGARLIASALPRVLHDPHDRAARAELLRGACHAGDALARSGLCLGHALAQALGGRLGLPHGALNAICLPPALRFNEPVAREALERLAAAMDVRDAAARAEELAHGAGFDRLRDLGVPEDELPAVAEATAARPGARANPRPAAPDEILALLRSVW